MVNKTVTDLFEQHLGAHEYDAFVEKVIRWYYNGGFAKVAWCAISMSYMANQLGILDQFGGRNQNCYEMLVSVEKAVKKTGKGKVWRRGEFAKGMKFKRGDVVFILKSDPPMNAGSSKHVTSVYSPFEWKGTGTFQSLGGNQSDYIQVKAYPQSQIYAVFRPDYAEDKDEKPTPAPTPTPSKEHKTLEKGDSGADVKAMQSALRKIGFGKITGQEMIADGKFGKITKATVIAFQVCCGLKPDGIVGTKQTWPMIDKLLSMPSVRSEALTDIYKRIGPGKNYKSLGVIKEGSKLTFTTVLDGWVYIPAVKGWSRSRFVKM